MMSRYKPKTDLVFVQINIRQKNHKNAQTDSLTISHFVYTYKRVSFDAVLPYKDIRR